MKRIVLASNNKGKVREIGQLLANLDIEVVPQSEYGVVDIEETGLSFVENAILKARNAAQHTGLPAIADDSGLEVDALNGEPGIYSARYAGVGASDSDNVQKLLDELNKQGEVPRTARFQCLLVYVRHALDPTPLICQGTWDGVIVDTPQGDNGFGYDPIFYVITDKCTAAQLAPERKNALSHRGQALKCLLDKLAKA
jgi:XTP/dITP diphosphohydrolase